MQQKLRQILAAAALTLPRVTVGNLDACPCTELYCQPGDSLWKLSRSFGVSIEHQKQTASRAT